MSYVKNTCPTVALVVAGDHDVGEKVLWFGLKNVFLGGGGDKKDCLSLMIEFPEVEARLWPRL
jgi:hypothetical protein